MNTQQQLLAALTNYVVDELRVGESIGADESLLEGGIVDSLGVVRIANFIDEEFEIQIPPSDFTRQNFESLKTLAAYVAQRMEATD